MKVAVMRTEYREVEALRELYRQEANCQIIHDSCLPRGLSDPYSIAIDGRPAGYGAVWNKYHVDRIMEFYVLPYARPFAQTMFRTLLTESKAKQIEAQTNMPLMLTMLYDFATHIAEENILFADAGATNLTCPNGRFRLSDTGKEPQGEWVIETDGAVVATGGFLCHYNPPYGDVYMEVEEAHRRQGYGSYLVQELKQVCYEAGKRPAARCNPKNIASRATLQKAGMMPCGRMLAGRVRKSSTE